jgi:hypothetical protein
MLRQIKNSTNPILSVDKRRLRDTTTIQLYNDSRFIPEGVDETSQIFLRDTHILPKQFGYKK